MQELEGFVDNIVYQNDENGYAIAKLVDRGESITIVGYIPYLSEGQSLRVFGEWIAHPDYCQQFKVQNSE